MIYISKVVSKNFVEDLFAKVQNFLGKNITIYEDMIRKGMKEIETEMESKKLKWFHFQITELTGGAISITMYGEETDESI